MLYTGSLLDLASSIAVTISLVILRCGTGVMSPANSKPRLSDFITGPQFDFRFLLVNHHIINASVWPLPYKIY